VRWRLDDIFIISHKKGAAIPTLTVSIMQFPTKVPPFRTPPNQHFSAVVISDTFMFVLQLPHATLSNLQAYLIVVKFSNARSRRSIFLAFRFCF
jgi:hypothetical protein